MLPLNALSIGAPSIIKPGLGYFEPWLRELSRAEPPAAPIDLRVAKAMGPTGYNSLRISVISTDGPVDLSHLHPSSSYNDSFRFRWEGAFDMGVATTSCGAAVYNTSTLTWDADCLLKCTHDGACKHYTWFPAAHRCELSGAACTFQADGAAEATYVKLGTNHLSSAIVPLQVGANSIRVGGNDVVVSLPAPGAGVRGVVISDPCFSRRWIDCEFSESWDVYNRTHLMLNAIAAHDDVDFFGVLGDNFYDQDGRPTRAIWDRLSIDFKRRYLLTVPGNHDIWVGGGPPSDYTDQFAWGFSQFYAQDTVAALTSPNGFMHFESGGPDVMKQWGGFNNDVRNSFFFHTIGDLGFVGYAGAAPLQTLKPHLNEACAYFGSVAPPPRAIFVLGHWNDVSSGCQSGADTPDVRALLDSIDGCRGLGDRLKFIDGHTHCNQIQQRGEHEAVGFMVGGHGMSGCSQYGFAVVDSTDEASLRVLYFEERSTSRDAFDAILACVQTSGISGCEHLAAAVWLESKR